MSDSRATEMVTLTMGDSVATLRVCNPPLNLLTTGIFGKLRARLSEASARSEIRALILTSEEGVPFSAGSDMSEFERLRDDAAGKKVLAENLALTDLEDFPVPTIAAIEEYALGGGLELALACDLRIVASDARLALSEPRVGGLASNGAQRLTALIGPGRASQMLFLAEELIGEQAVTIGLANWAVPAGEADKHANDVAARIAELAPTSIRLAKRIVLSTARRVGADSFLESVRAQQAVFASPELTQGVKAFFEKRKPDFTDLPQEPEGRTQK